MLFGHVPDLGAIRQRQRENVSSGSEGYVVLMAGNAGLRSPIFAPRAAHSQDFVVVIGRSWMAVDYLLGQYVVSQLVKGVGRKPPHDAQGANGLVTPRMGRRRRQKHLANEPMPHHHPVQFRESCRQSGVVMRRMILSVFGGLLAAALLISSAHAVKPVIVLQSQ
jgi:hypothetical protein